MWREVASATKFRVQVGREERDENDDYGGVGCSFGVDVL